MPVVKHLFSVTPVFLSVKKKLPQGNDESEKDYGLRADTLINEAIPTNTRCAYLGDVFYIRQWSLYANVDWPMSEETVLKFIIHHLEEMPVRCF
ncbi:MAG TPA: hypothetical protein VIH61_01840 [Waddliaceae bacterium]